MPAVQETVDQVRRIDVDQYKYGFVTDIESEKAPKGLSRRHRPLHLGQEERAGMDAGLAAGSLSALADHARADLGARRLSQDRLPERLLLFGAEEEARWPRSTRSIRKFSRPTRSSAFRCASRKCWPASCDPKASARVAVDAVFDSRLGRHHLQGRAEEGRRDLHADVGGDPRASRAGEEISRLGGADLGQFLRHAQFGGVLRRLVRLRAAGRALPDGAVDLFPHQRAEHRPVRAHADHRRQGRLRVSYLEGCTAPMRDENQLHAAVVELVALDDAEIKYSTVQNWYPGDAEGKGGIFNFVTKRGDCRGARSKISWTQVETGSAITWKYPSCILRGDNSRGEFYSIAISNGRQQVD